MFAKNLQCVSCGAVYEPGIATKCPKCGGIMEVRYDYSGLDIDRAFEAPRGATPAGIWRFRDFLPLEDEANIVTLGEGNTPLLPSGALGKELGLERLFFKLDSLNPSGSFKDRGISVAISRAKEMGVSRVVVASTGNASASTAAYAAKAGMECVVCVPDKTSPAKVGQAVSHGARLVLVKGDFSNSYGIALEASQKLGWVNTSTTFLNPYNLEGNKTVAYELWLGFGRTVPDAVVVPVGAGPLLAGMAKGFEELRGFGLIDRLPRLAAVQAEVCSPIYEAFRSGKERVEPWDRPFSTLAAGVGDPLKGYADDGTFTLDAVRRTGGTVVTMDEEEISRAAVDMAHLEGLYLEPTSAIAGGALRKLRADGFLAPGELVVSMMTGHGLKHYLPMEQEPLVVGSFEEFEAAIGRRA